jgi:hypothetical protein
MKKVHLTIVKVLLLLLAKSSTVNGITVDVNSIIQTYSNCHVHLLSAYGFEYGPILYPVVLSTLEYVNVVNHVLKYVSPLVKETCLSHTVIGNFPLDLNHIIRHGILDRFLITWKLEYYWGGFDKFPNGGALGFYYKEASNVYMNIVTEDAKSWKIWMYIFHNARWPVFQKNIFYFMNDQGKIMNGIVCHNCYRGSSTLIPLGNSREALTKESLDLKFRDLQIHLSDGLTLLSFETLRNYTKLPMSLIPEPEDLLNALEEHDWQLFVLFAKLVYRECANATLNALAITNPPDIYSFIL